MLSARQCRAAARQGRVRRFDSWPQALNALGYGRDPALTLNLVYNPQGPSLPPSQSALEAEYKRVLGEQHGIVFNKLYVLANMPIQRFGSTLITKGEFEAYLGLLQDAHLDANLDGVMCRTLISMDWRGYIYDCDFNQMLDLPMTRNRARVCIWPICSTTRSRAIRSALQVIATVARQAKARAAAARLRRRRNERHEVIDHRAGTE